MSSLIEQFSLLSIGTVEFVSPTEIKVLLELDAPQATALNTGIPTGFPRINSYLLIPNEAGAVVGLVVWLGVERSAFPKRTGLKDFGLVDLPFPLRKLALTPLGMLVRDKKEDGIGYESRLQRGVSVFPSVGDPVILPTAEQLRSIVESKGVDRRIRIGTSPLAANVTVSVDPDKLFGGHLAVLGNTGSGKSCTVAGLIRWSLEEAEKEKSSALPRPNARFIILDPNGEYSKTFSDLKDSVRIFRVPPVEAGSKELSLPAWMWNSAEWSAFASASSNTQRPILMQGLRNMRSAAVVTAPVERRIQLLFKSRLSQLQGIIGQGAAAYSGAWSSKMKCGSLIQNVLTEAQEYSQQITDELSKRLSLVAAAASEIAKTREFSYQGKPAYNDFNEIELRRLSDSLVHLLEAIPSGLSEEHRNEDAPIPFPVSEFPDHLDMISAEEGGGTAAQFVSWLTMRIRMMLADSRLGPILNPVAQPAFDEWLGNYIGEDGAKNGQIAILDLSLVPSDVIHIVIAVIARLIFEATQRYRKLNEGELPSVLVLEEAHTFIRRGGDGGENVAPSAAQMCRETFERIAREGRKFGLGLVLSSQRPSELSQTVLAQCNTFIIHRVVNDRDQELVGRLVPDNLGGLLSELPSLPARQAILLGWATPIPVLVEIRELPEKQRPQSSNPSFWDVWTGKKERRIDWKQIAEDWTT